jgi:hypothetical protein
MIINYDCNCSFIVLATVIMIVNYDGKTFIVQANEFEDEILGDCSTFRSLYDLKSLMILVEQKSVWPMSLCLKLSLWPNLSL